jgi:hypothetical protein
MHELIFNAENIAKLNTVLDDAREILDKEFISVDEFIDQVLDSLSNWYLFPQLQEQPVIINLWGLTGVDKTAMVLRLAELLEFDKRTFRYDMGNKSDSSPSLKSILHDLLAHLEILSTLPRSRHSLLRLNHCGGRRRILVYFSFGSYC